MHFFSFSEKCYRLCVCVFSSFNFSDSLFRWHNFFFHFFVTLLVRNSSKSATCYKRDPHADLDFFFFFNFEMCYAFAWPWLVLIVTGVPNKMQCKNLNKEQFFSSSVFDGIIQTGKHIIWCDCEKPLAREWCVFQCVRDSGRPSLSVSVPPRLKGCTVLRSESRCPLWQMSKYCCLTESRTDGYGKMEWAGQGGLVVPRAWASVTC